MALGGIIFATSLTAIGVSVLAALITERRRDEPQWAESDARTDALLHQIINEGE